MVSYDIHGRYLPFTRLLFYCGNIVIVPSDVREVSHFDSKVTLREGDTVKVMDVVAAIYYVLSASDGIPVGMEP